MSILNALGLRRSPRNHRTRGSTTTRQTEPTTGLRTKLFGTKRRGGTGLFGTSRRKDRTTGFRVCTLHRINQISRLMPPKDTLTNPNTTHSGRKHAKHELHMRGESAQ
jgi:hypothetical protein